ncbi:hypothetical protein GCM10011581_34160 [Saccharopolyspora subtropica]|uniref:Uncharacterized protein n=1 Tax=Saccharopolyspora thermophila TaxID=89367 RepID=A0A917NEX4_9PSEU|nr:hypothetical protein [Saccharopolyspora subtropica]GGI94209.1 hypothetical protein GCM10011581_34160 [Saccharopolyspora subtropica]
MTATVPTRDGGDLPGIGTVLRWDEPRSAALFAALAQDRPIPPAVLSP